MLKSVQGYGVEDTLGGGGPAAQSTPQGRGKLLRATWEHGVLAVGLLSSPIALSSLPLSLPLSFFLRHDFCSVVVVFVDISAYDGVNMGN